MESRLEKLEKLQKELEANRAAMLEDYISKSITLRDMIDEERRLNSPLLTIKEHDIPEIIAETLKKAAYKDTTSYRNMTGGYTYLPSDFITLFVQEIKSKCTK